MEQLSEIEVEVNSVVKAMQWCDCDVIPSAFGDYTVACSEDLTYYHTIELRFTGVLFVYSRYDFQVDTEKGLFVNNDPTDSPVFLDSGVSPEDYKMYTIREDNGRTYCIASEGLTVSYDSVLRYYREDLDPEQRIASWVEKP